MNAGFGRPTRISVDSQVTATGEAHVGQQTGVQFVDSVLHDAKIYTTLSGDPPDRLHEVARAHLDGSNPRRAEEIFRSLLADGHFTTERAYFYVLSILSDRSFTEITAALSNEIHNAMDIAAKLPKDEWQGALDVVDTLLRDAHAEFVEGSGAQELASGLELFGVLDTARQNEIDRHLSLILSGAVQEWLAGERKYQVGVERMSRNRVGRAWKFFEADPLPPMRWQVPPVRAAVTDWRDALLGSLATVSAIVAVSVDGITVRAVVGLALVAIGGYFALRFTTVQQTAVCYAKSLWSDHQAQYYQQETDLDKLVDWCFYDGGFGRRWEITAGCRGYLKRRLRQQYDRDGIYPGELKWLIMLHVVRFGRQYDNPPPSPPGADYTMSFRSIGVMIWATGLASIVTGGHLLAFLLGLGGSWGIRGIARIAAVSRARALIDRDAEAIFTEERTEYHRWVQVLRDRPLDAEMARWLALDKAYLKDDALRRANLRERDLVTYVVLTERAPFARKGRVADGPPRYEAYLVYVFLLTQYGVRTTRTFLSLTSGDMRNEQRQMFTYDAVASASVVEKGVRTFLTDGRPLVVSQNERVFQLTLLNGTCIAEVRENRRATVDDHVSMDNEPGDVTPVEASGFDSALQVLEAVASEGKDWIDRDRERKLRWARNWNMRSHPDDEKGVDSGHATGEADDANLPPHPAATLDGRIPFAAPQ